MSSGLSPSLGSHCDLPVTGCCQKKPRTWPPYVSSGMIPHFTSTRKASCSGSVSFRNSGFALFLCPLPSTPVCSPALYTVWYLIVAATQTQRKVSWIGSFPVDAQGTQALWEGEGGAKVPFHRWERVRLERKDLPRDTHKDCCTSWDHV